MPQTGGEESARIERANRLRSQIEKLKSGRPARRPGKAPSIKEQIEERARMPAPQEKNREE
jgi:hypothetical protein